MSLNKDIWKAVREKTIDFLTNEENSVRAAVSYKHSIVTADQKDSTMYIPAKIGDYTDFYASENHAANVGTMFRGKDNALMPNYHHLPVGYHGRASSVVVSGTDLKRPRGQIPSPDGPRFGPSMKLDFELEVAVFIGSGNDLGTNIPIETAEDYIFGFVLMNDWSARDIQAWEYVPLGPFLAKNFGTTISPWVVTTFAMAPFKTALPSPKVARLDYLKDDPNSGYDCDLFVSFKPKNSADYKVISHSNLKYLSWSFKQQLAHHTIGGCNLRPGDLLGSGTISGTTQDSLGSMLEMSWNGKNTIPVSDSGETRSFINDGDTIKISGYCQGDGYRVGFGNCTGMILP
ncbi:Fumarylacetoacetase [Smittium culicis]|uniref:Fumarylacetoacetase n=1 Tax=Smittium culicis TaxID=133412 RepID=A0A1R1YMA6_9FUNG|nr:Fumarylacetoacetase [Smittium culicis]